MQGFAATRRLESQKAGSDSACGAVFFGIEQLGEARIFLEEREVLIVARVIAILAAKLDGHFEILERGIPFSGEAIESGQGIMKVVGFRRSFASFVQALAVVVPAAD